MNSRHVVKISFYLLFATICFSQCYTIVKSYLQYPTVIDMYDASSNITTLLPTITICNNNRLSLKKLAMKDPDIKKALDETFPDGWRKSMLDEANFTKFRDDIARMFKKISFIPQEKIDNSSLNELFELKPDNEPYIRWIGCARSWSDSVQCLNLTKIDSIQDRKCLTILHRGALTHDFVHKPHLFNSSKITEGFYSYFDAKEVIKVIVDFEPEDYADLKRQIGSRVFFHDSNFIPSSTDLDYFITRGNRYQFNIDREDSFLLNEPYDRCKDYQEGNLVKFRSELNPRVPIHGVTCSQNCVIKNIIHTSNCWPPSMPYFRNDSYDPGLNIKACDLAKQSQHYIIQRELTKIRREKIRSQYMNSSLFGNQSLLDSSTSELLNKRRLRAYKQVRRFCWSKCPQSCKMTKYTVSVTKTPWPSDIRVTFDKRDEQKMLRHCCAIFSVKYSQLNYNVQEFMPKYNLVDTIGNVGGLLAVWMGLSIISIYHAIQKLIEFCNKEDK